MISLSHQIEVGDVMANYYTPFSLRDTGCSGGFMTWNGGSDINKYQSIISALS